MNKNTLIPLGDHCAPSLLLRDIGLRTNAYPFDWVMATNVDTNIITTFLDITCRLLETKDPDEITKSYIGDLKIPDYTKIGRASCRERVLVRV